MPEQTFRWRAPLCPSAGRVNPLLLEHLADAEAARTPVLPLASGQ